MQVPRSALYRWPSGEYTVNALSRRFPQLSDDDQHIAGQAGGEADAVETPPIRTQGFPTVRGVIRAPRHHRGIDRLVAEPRDQSAYDEEHRRGQQQQEL